MIIKKWEKFLESLNIDDLLDAKISGGHIYFDEVNFLNKSGNLLDGDVSFKRVRNIDNDLKLVIDKFPNIILFKIEDKILIPYLFDNGDIEGFYIRKIGEHWEIGQWEYVGGEFELEKQYISDLNSFINDLLLGHLDKDGKPFIGD